jgi:hypothetical protein
LAKIAIFSRGDALNRESLIAAARKSGWESAAAVAHRRQVSDERNKEIAGLFLGQNVDA